MPMGRTANTSSCSIRPFTSALLLESLSSRVGLSTSLRPCTPPWSLTISKYACTPSYAVSYLPPSGLVTEATPPTVISVSVTPGASTATFSVLSVAVPSEPAVVPVSFAVVEPPLDSELPHAAATMTSAIMSTVQRLRTTTPRLSG